MAQQGMARTYSPYASSQSPSPTTNSPIGGGIHIPPAKKLRLSPDPRSPHPMNGISPTYGGGLTLPTPAPKPLSQPFHQPQPLHDLQNGDLKPRQGSMGPPPQPVQHDGEEVLKSDKVTDVNKLQDVINDAGVDVSAEEEYLANTFRNVRNFGYQNESFGTTTSTTLTPNTSFTQLSQSMTGHPAWQGSGPSSQPTQSQEAINRGLKRKHETAARAHAEETQDHLRSPCLLLNVVRHKLRQRAFENGVQLDMNGLFDPIQNIHHSQASPYHPNSTVMGGQNGPGLVSAKSHALLQPNANLADMLALISLATNERIRGLVEDAYGFSRGRRAGADGVVPPEWSDLAIGNGEKPTTAVSESITNTAWDQPPGSAVSPTSNPLKRKLSDRLPTKSFTSPLPAHLRSLAASDRDAEKARLKARKLRHGTDASSTSTSAAPTNGAAASSQASGTSGTATPAPGTVLPELQGAVKMSKKEREKAKKADLNEEVMHKNANQAATSAFGKTFSRFSWLTGGGGGGAGGSPAGSGASTPRGGAPAANGVGGGGAGAVGATGLGKNGAAGGAGSGVLGKEKKWGEWREDGERGAGVQIRDWIEALEKDGKERKALVLALAKLNSRELNGAERIS
ncbi:MAG: hypothetical protein Q9165_006672 [Trypethelium subeluteriae]